MTTFYFIRHGQTEWNLERRFQGGNGDSPLLPASYADMAALADFLVAKAPFAAAYTSPVKRAKVTAERTVAAMAPTVSLIPVADPALAEVNLGDWEGMHVDAIAEQYPEAYHAYRHDLDNFDGQAFHGEGYTAATTRFVAAIRKIAAAHPDEAVLIFAHGMILSFGVTALLNLPPMATRARGGLSNTSTTTLTTTDGSDFKLVDWNNTTYLNKPNDSTTTV